MTCWKRPCEFVEILGCCYLYVETRKWQYIHDPSKLPPEWIMKVKRFNETYHFADEDVILGYVAIFKDSSICSVLAIVLYGNKDDQLVVDFIDIDEWLRFVEQHSTH